MPKSISFDRKLIFFRFFPILNIPLWLITYGVQGSARWHMYQSTQSNPDFWFISVFISRAIQGYSLEKISKAVNHTSSDVFWNLVTIFFMWGFLWGSYRRFLGMDWAKKLISRNFLSSAFWINIKLFTSCHLWFVFPSCYS